MKIFFTACLFLILVVSLSVITQTPESVANQRFLIVSFGENDAVIVAQGNTNEDKFRTLFLDSYRIAGERYHPGENAFLWGQLVAFDGLQVVNVPIWKWTMEDGGVKLLCQATDDGTPPAISVFAESDDELTNMIVRLLEE